MRAITGRDLIIKVEGGYHGHHDSVQVSVAPDADEVGPADRPNQVPSSTGIPRAITDLAPAYRRLTTLTASPACSPSTPARSPE